MSELMPYRWVYIFGMENEGDLLGGMFGMAADLYKIGTTISPLRRWHQVQVHSPWDLRVFALFPGGFDVEAVVHRHFEEHRTRGEWFTIPRHVMCGFLEEMEGRIFIGMPHFPSLPWVTIALNEDASAERSDAR